MAVHAIIQNNRRRRYMNLLLDSGKLFRAIKQNINARQRKLRKHWIRPGRTSSWWDNFSNNVVVDEDWRENFKHLCQQLAPFLQKQVTNMRKPVDVEKQIVVTLYYLSDEGRYRKVVIAFGIASRLCR